MKQVLVHYSYQKAAYDAHVRCVHLYIVPMDSQKGLRSKIINLIYLNFLHREFAEVNWELLVICTKS